MSQATFAVPALLTTVAVTGGGMSGALHATRRNMDLTGITIVAVCTGVGGGALRDILIGNGIPIFLVQNWLAMALIGALAGYFFARFVEQLGPAIFVIDSLLIGVWVVFGAEKALATDMSWSAVILIGLIAAIGGGLIRDVLCRETPTALMPGQWVAGAAFLASVLFVTVYYWTGNRLAAEIVAIAVATGLRLASAQYGWKTPTAISMSERLRKSIGMGKTEKTEGPVESLP